MLNALNSFYVRLMVAMFALIAGGSAALAQWAPDFDGVSATTIQDVLQSVLDSYQTWITALVVFIGLMVGAAIIVAFLNKRNPVKM